MTILQSGIAQAAAGGGGYQIARSLRFNSADSAYLSRTPASAGNLQTWTWSSWVKRSNLGTDCTFFNNFRGSPSTNEYVQLAFTSTDKLDLYCRDASAVVIGRLTTTQVFRDAGAWYHIVCVADTTNATSSSRLKLYVNGIQITAFDTATYPSQNTNLGWNLARAALIGAGDSSTPAYNIAAYQTEINFIDGQALTPSSFGQTDSATGVWNPKQVTGMTYGTNGFYLNFSDNSGVTATTLGKDSSGNSNNWTPNNFSVTAGVGNDSLVDSPTNYGTDTGVGGEVRGNYGTWNPLDKNSNTTLVNGNLDASYLVGAWAAVRATFGLSSGKWYWEVTPTTITTSMMVGIGKADAALSFPGASATSWGYYSATGALYNNSSSSAYGASYTVSNVIGVALDLDNGTLAFYKNGTSQGTAATGLTSGPYFPMVGHENAASSINFGQRPFAYTAPSGFKALCTQNLPTPAIGATSSTLASKNMNIALYTGTGASQAITGLGFRPDFVWYKDRSNARDHGLFDVVRGATNYLASNASAAEQTVSGVTSFDADGFTLGGAINSNNTNETYVAWNWKAGGTGVTNTSGTITSTVSANTAAGISVVTFTGNGTAGATVGHGLGVAPAMVIVKYRGGVGSWAVYHKSLGATQWLTLNGTGGATTSAQEWNNTAPTSSVFSIGSSSANSNQIGANLAYCFAEVAGFSKFGSYTGNGTQGAGPFVYTGFRPRYVVVKKTSSSGTNWHGYDTSRSPYNYSGSNILKPDDSAAELTARNDVQIDILSNGFRLIGNDIGINENGGTFIFMAFAEAPFNYSRAR